MRHLKLLAITVIVIVGVPVLLTGPVTGQTPVRSGLLPNAAFQRFEVRAETSAVSSGTLAVAVEPTPAPVIFETRDASPPVPDVRPRVKQQEPQKRVELKATPKPKGGGSHDGFTATGRSISGAASWYCRAGVSVCHYAYPDTRGFNAYAAAGPSLRKAICGSTTSNCWRGKVVSVDGINVKLVDWCQCYKGQAHEKVLDLYYDVFKRVGGSVTVRW